MTKEKLYTPTMAIFFLLICLKLAAQPGTDWDDNQHKNWPPNTYISKIKSTKDGEPQLVYCYSSKSAKRRPLVISLHTWSGDFQQMDPLVSDCIEQDINYIHPDFRGPNIRPEACGSEFVVQDIDDAIDWALANMNVDENNIHVVGVSGGAHATLITYMKSKHHIKTFHAFVGIYNLVDWYYESLGRKNVYASHIVAVTSGVDDTPDFEEARNRSPFFMNTPTKMRAFSTLNLICGLHDGYTGSVPISQTLELYNKIVNDFDSNEQLSVIPQSHIYTLLKRRQLDVALNEDKKFMNRTIIYSKSFKEKVNVIVFDGGHEMPEGNTLSFLSTDL